MALKLIHFPQTRSIRVAWALKELDIEAEIETRQFDRASLKSDEYRALNPLGKTPVFLEDGKPMVESTAIIHYLSEKYGDGRLSRRPSDDDYGPFLQFLHFGEAGMGGYVNILIAHTALLPEEQRVPALQAWSKKETGNCMDFIERSLGGRDYLLGEFSLADISIGYMLYLCKITRNGDLLGEETANYFKRLAARPAWQAVSALEPPK